ncbi:hypothetical protein HY745_04250, partial [Candidatus Desantisbacteria bacterium]|nr:hypothetical protein [Candidatus Desantisbacteria bacterium]
IEESVHLTFFPHPEEKYILNDEAEKRWEKIFALKIRVNIALEQARKNKIIGHSLESHVIIKIFDENLYQLLIDLKDDLMDFLIVTSVTLEKDSLKNVAEEDKTYGYTVIAEKASGNKCGRCWKYYEKTETSEEDKALCPRCSEIINQI